ncbi:Cytochrome P450 [Sesbania bispinosa]|nr:Cytochrome P450 [Sesbania bispinosa]
MAIDLSSLSSYYHLIFTALAFLFSCLILLLTQKTKSKKLNLPPGPPGWPIVGNLFQVARSGKPFFEYVNEMRGRYGSIFTLKMGKRTMIILTDSKLVHESMIQKGALYATRPPENPTRNIFSANKFTVNAAVYGPVWKSLRRNMVQNMLSSTRLKEFRGVRDNAMDKLINRLRVEAEKNNGVVWVLKDARGKELLKFVKSKLSFWFLLLRGEREQFKIQDQITLLQRFLTLTHSLISKLKGKNQHLQMLNW